MHIGGLDAIHQLNEAGELSRMLKGFEHRSAVVCGTCGGAGYIPCKWCQGSKKSISHAFSGKNAQTVSLKCTVCNENGLQRCDNC